jgi:hypothetical protein
MCLLDMSTTQGPELHLDMSGQLDPFLLLDISTLQGHEMNLNIPR